MRLLLLPCATTAFSLIALWRLRGATSRGEPWMPAGTRPHGRDGLRAGRTAVVWTFREPSLGRPRPHAFRRNMVLHLPLIIPAPAGHHSTDVERYRRCSLALHEILLDAVFCVCIFAVFAPIYRRYPARFRNGIYY
jgi:hypothetical protein